jgi:cytoskeletal protein CcmA (bactofilin family)
MFGRDSMRPVAVDILIGKTARIRGDIDFAGGLHLDGRVAGHVRADPDSASTLSVSETGWIEGSAQAADVILNGTVRGDILASGRVALGPRAKVHGDVHYGSIETALGAEILGRLVPRRRSSARGAGKAGAAAGERAAAGEVGAAAGERAAAGELTAPVAGVAIAVGEVAAVDAAEPIEPAKPAGPSETA